MTEYELKVLKRLAMAVGPYVADQDDAKDPRCGIVQPVTVAEAEELNEAYWAAWGVVSVLQGGEVE